MFLRLFFLHEKNVGREFNENCVSTETDFALSTQPELKHMPNIKG